VFVKFGDCGSLDQHGFARNKIWVIDENPPPLNSNESLGKSFVDLLLKPSEDDLKQWPHSFEFRLRVSLAVDGDLTLTSRIRNINGKPFSFSFAYHTYLSVSDIRYYSSISQAKDYSVFGEIFITQQCLLFFSTVK
jgi:glucose-6-phosphate 1-epimerase